MKGKGRGGGEEEKEDEKGEEKGRKRRRRRRRGMRRGGGREGRGGEGGGGGGGAAPGRRSGRIPAGFLQGNAARTLPRISSAVWAVPLVTVSLSLVSTSSLTIQLSSFVCCLCRLCHHHHHCCRPPNYHHYSDHDSSSPSGSLSISIATLPLNFCESAPAGQTLW